LGTLHPLRGGDWLDRDLHVAGRAIGIQRGLQPERRGAQDPQSHGLAARRRELVVRRRRHDFAAVAVGDDQAGSRRNELAGEIRSNGKEEAVAELAVGGPFLVSAKVGRTRFDLNDPDFTGNRNPRQIRASAVCQRKLTDDREPMRPQKPSDAAADLESGLRAARFTDCLNLRGHGASANSLEDCRLGTCTKYDDKCDDLAQSPQ
jgi:hypothetical protein